MLERQGAVHGKARLSVGSNPYCPAHDDTCAGQWRRPRAPAATFAVGIGFLSVITATITSAFIESAIAKAGGQAGTGDAGAQGSGDSS